MRPNEARRRLAAGQPILGATVSCASPLVAETMGHLGYDWVLLDLQHGENNLGNLATLLTAVSATPTSPRLPCGRCATRRRATAPGGRSAAHSTAAQTTTPAPSASCSSW